MLDLLEKTQALYEYHKKALNNCEKGIASLGIETKSQLYKFLEDERKRLQQDIEFFDKKTSPLVFKGTKNEADLETSIRHFVSKLNKTQLMELLVQREKELFNADQILNYLFKVKRAETTSRTDAKTHALKGSTNRNTKRNDRFAPNNAYLQKCLEQLKQERKAELIPTDFGRFRSIVISQPPPYKPRTRESSEEKSLSFGDRKKNLKQKRAVRKANNGWSPTTISSFWIKHTRLKATLKKLSSLK